MRIFTDLQVIAHSSRELKYSIPTHLLFFVTWILFLRHLCIALTALAFQGNFTRGD
jgi:hypothetical protein